MIQNSNEPKKRNFGFGEETDREKTRMRFWIQLIDPGILPGMLELIADGITEVHRQPAEMIEGGRFRINARIVDMKHEGTHKILGGFEVDVDADHPTLGVIEGAIDPESSLPRIDSSNPARSYFDVRFRVATKFGTFVTGETPARMVNNQITTLFPDSPYTHDVAQEVLELYLEGKLSEPVARLAAGYHGIIPHGDGDEDEEGNDKVDPFPDVEAAMPKLIDDLKHAKKRIWMAWWAIDADFPATWVQGAAGLRPSSVLTRDVIAAALRDDPDLELYAIIWTDGSSHLVSHKKRRQRLFDSLYLDASSRDRVHLAFQMNLSAALVPRAHHEKFILVDLDRDYSDEGAVLWCRGWDGMITYWDEHMHSHPNRFQYKHIHDKLNQNWHDSAIRVVSQDSSEGFEEEFRRRWQNSGPNGDPLQRIAEYNYEDITDPFPVFQPNMVGNTSVGPLIHKEQSVGGPIYEYYHDSLKSLKRSFYIEDQYFYEADEIRYVWSLLSSLARGDAYWPLPPDSIPKAMIDSYLKSETNGVPIHGAVVICHPDIVEPPPTAQLSSMQIANVRAHTAKWVELANIKHASGKRNNGPIRYNRPLRGWEVVRIVRGHGRHYRIQIKDGGKNLQGDLVRAGGGISCLTLITPDKPKPLPIYLHSKLAVMEGDNYTIGSSNISFGSFNPDSEANVVVWDDPDNPVETQRVMKLFFTNLVGGRVASNLSDWVDNMTKVASGNYDLIHRKGRAAPVGLLTEYPYEVAKISRSILSAIKDILDR